MFMQLFPYSYNLAAINPLFFVCLSHFLINSNMFSDFFRIICCVLYFVYFVFVDCLLSPLHYISIYSYLISPTSRYVFICLL